MKEQRLMELVVQSLEHEMGGVQVYETALTCAVNNDLSEEWTEYLQQTRKHVEVLRGLCEKLGFDPELPTPGREIVRTVGEALVAAMKKALSAGDPAAAEIVACECVVLAETKDHADWELLSQCADKAPGEQTRAALKTACDEVEDEEDEHLYHSKGWCRELWLQALGMPAILPPPEEQYDVKTAVGAAKAQHASARSR